MTARDCNFENQVGASVASKVLLLKSLWRIQWYFTLFSSTKRTFKNVMFITEWCFFEFLHI